MEKTPINVRIDSTLNSYIRALCEEQHITFTHATETLLQIGLENRKDANPRLEKKRRLALDAVRFQEADDLVHIELKKAYTVENFRKLIHKIAQSRDMTPTRREAVVDAMFQRIEDVFGKESPEYIECERIAHVRKEGKI